jgi:hypothetical protein
MKEVGHITAGKCRLSKECSIILLRIVESVIAKWKSANPSLTVNDQNKQLWCLVQKKNGRPQLGHVDTGDDDTRFLQILVPLNVHMQSKFGTGASYSASTEWLEMTDKGKYQSTVETSDLQEDINSLPSGWAKDGTYKGENLGLGDAISSYTDFPHRGPGNQATATHEPTDDRYALILLLPLNQSNSNCDSVIHEQPQSSDSEEFADNARMQTPLKGSKGTAQINCKHVLSPTDRPTPAKEVCSGREYNTDNVSISLTDAAGGTTSTCTKLGELDMDLVKASHAHVYHRSTQDRIYVRSLE